MSIEKDLLRKAAGLSFETKRNLFEENISKVKTLDIETELLRIFSNSIRDIKRIKDIMDGRTNFYYGQADQYKLKDEFGKIDKKKLFDLSMEKLDIMEESLAECFGFSKEEAPKKEPEESSEEEEV
jgi:hypothetical protein